MATLCLQTLCALLLPPLNDKSLQQLMPKHPCATTLNVCAQKLDLQNWRAPSMVFC